MSDINKRSDFEEELEILLNKHGKDAELSVPDFWLADFINSMLEELVNVVVHHPRDEDHFSNDVEINGDIESSTARNKQLEELRERIGRLEDELHDDRARRR